MPRSLRIALPNIPFHVLNRGNNRQTIFREEGDFIYFMKLMQRYKKELSFRLYHFCLMPNHTHFIMEPTEEGMLSKVMLRLTLAYTWYFNKKYKTTGHAWQGRYKASLIDKDNYFIWCGIYSELNPVRAGLVQSPEDWRWSSFRYYAFGQEDPLIEGLLDDDPYYLTLGNNPKERQARYRDNMAGVIKEDFLKRIRKGLDAGAWGSDTFVQEMVKRFGVGELRPRGRPRKYEI